MRAGWVVSLIGHIGAVLMTLLAWETRSVLEARSGSVVPIEIVDVAEESNVRAQGSENQEEAAAADQTTAAQPEEAAPEESPAPPPERQRNQRSAEEEQEALLRNTDSRGRTRPTPGPPSSNPREASGLGTEERVTLQARADSLTKRALESCWRTVADMPEPERLVVVVSFRLNRDGSVNGQPRVVRPANTTFDPVMAEAVRRAVSAVQVCDQRNNFARLTTDPLVGEHYELWRDNEVEFGLRIQ
jgi:hypothetical protein